MLIDLNALKDMAGMTKKDIGPMINESFGKWQMIRLWSRASIWPPMGRNDQQINLFSCLFGSGLYREDDPSSRASVNSDQNRNSVESSDLSDHPQKTHYRLFNTLEEIRCSWIFKINGYIKDPRGLLCCLPGWLIIGKSKQTDGLLVDAASYRL